MTAQPALGRIVSKDPRDKHYLLPTRRAAAAPITSRLWYTRGVLDQGSTSQCVAYSGVKYLTSHPVCNKPLDTFQLYKECQRNDEWPGEDYDGTSVRALFKVLKSKGLVSEYRWAFDCETVVNHLLTTGPVVLGTVWYLNMFGPGSDGYLNCDGSVEGGHAYLAIGAYRNRKNPDKSRGAVRIINSWGSGWAQKGRAWITFRDLDRLIQDDGEACVSTELAA